MDFSSLFVALLFFLALLALIVVLILRRGTINDAFSQGSTSGQRQGRGKPIPIDDEYCNLGNLDSVDWVKVDRNTIKSGSSGWYRFLGKKYTELEADGLKVSGCRLFCCHRDEITRYAYGLSPESLSGWYKILTPIGLKPIASISPEDTPPEIIKEMVMEWEQGGRRGPNPQTELVQA